MFAFLCSSHSFICSFDLKFSLSTLFENPKIKDKFNPQTILKYLKNITGLDAINDQMMRNIFGPHFYKQNPTHGKKQELAQQMRLSVMVASMNYAKVFDEDDEEPAGKPSEDVEELNRENFRLKEELNKMKETMWQYTIKEELKDLPLSLLAAYSLFFRLEKKF